MDTTPAPRSTRIKTTTSASNGWAARRVEDGAAPRDGAEPGDQRRGALVAARGGVDDDVDAHVPVKAARTVPLPSRIG